MLQDNIPGVGVPPPMHLLDVVPLCRFKTRLGNIKLKVQGITSQILSTLRVESGEVHIDGSCGFRVIASCLRLGEDQWVQVRRDLIDEFESNKPLYLTIFGEDGCIAERMKILIYFNNYPKADHWMTMLDMGHLITLHYNIVLFFIFRAQFLTFLPLRSQPPSQTTKRKEIAIAFVSGYYFVLVIVNIFLSVDVIICQIDFSKLLLRTLVLIIGYPPTLASNSRCGC